MIWDPSIWYTRNDLAIYGGSIWRALVNNKAVIPEAGNANWELAVGGSSGGGAISGTIASGQVAVGSGVNAIGGSDHLRWDDDTNEVWLLVDPALTADRYTALGLFPTSTVDGSVLADTTFTVDPASNGFTYGGFIANTTVKSTNNKNIAFIDGFESHVNLDGSGGTITYAAANYLRVQGSGAATVTDAYLSQAGLAVAGTGSHVTHGYGYQIDSPSVDSAMTSYYAFRSEDIGTSATNGYYSWFDSRGVRRVREDTTFDSVGQAIDALYNPQFTKYVAGAANYERLILGQWNGNIAEIGTEKGGSGTLRNLRLIGTAIQLGADTILENGKALQTDTTTGHTALFRAYDVDGTAYKTFGTLTNGNTPDFTISPPAGTTVVLQATTYKSSDGSSGVTAGPFTTITAITVKNGLVTALTGS